jgi:hypothetical protein
MVSLSAIDLRVNTKRSKLLKTDATRRTEAQQSTYGCETRETSGGSWAIQTYPRTWNEFLDWFSSDEACATYLERLRWAKRFCVPEQRQHDAAVSR